MIKSALLLSAALCIGFAGVAGAQDTGGTTAPVNAPSQADPKATGAAPAEGEIIVTATRRADRLSNVPIAISAVTAASLQNSGANDIRQLQQLSPSLIVNATSSESTGGVARIRGVGTIGDNPGLESSVGVFIDGVYRSRSGVALTELGAIDSIEVLRGPQGTLFGRNATAGLINIQTQKPSFETAGDASFEYGNYNYYRGEVGITGPLFGGDKIAARVDGVYVKRDGFTRDPATRRRYNNRDRFLVRGQLLIKPTDDLSVRLIGDYAERSEQCCAATYAPLTDYVRDPATPVGVIGNYSLQPSRFAQLERAIGARLPASGNRDVSVTPGRDFNSAVTDWGGSGEIDWSPGPVNVTSITAYRFYKTKRGQDGDYNNLDLLYRDNFKQEFRTFSQELRVQGEALKGRLNYLVGGYFANEDLYVRDNLRFGSQYGQFANFLVGASENPANPAASPFFQTGGYANLPGFFNTVLRAQGLPAPLSGLISSQISPINLSNTGETADNYHQNSKNFAIFTHNQIKIVDRVTLTLGARYTDETKKLNTTLASDNTGLASLVQSARKVAALAVNPIFANNPALLGVLGNVAGQLTSPAGLAGIAGIANLNSSVDGPLAGRDHEGKFTGTAVLSYKPFDSLLVYGSYSRGYKAGGFNLDRGPLTPFNPQIATLAFSPETVDAYEAGLKYSQRHFSFAAALFREDFDNYQLNTFTGINFVVVNIEGCKTALNAPAPGNVYGSCPSGQAAHGVRSEGFELEASFRPVRDVTVNAGLTYADTKYNARLAGINGTALINPLFLLPGQTISQAPEYVVTTSAAFTPRIGTGGYSALFYIDTRVQSKTNTGSDLAPKKIQPDYVLTNARVGLRGPDQSWSLEFWGQNIFNTYYTQTAFDAPLQAPGGAAGQQVSARPAGSTYSANRSNTLYGRFLGDPRTFGLTLRTKF